MSTLADANQNKPDIQEMKSKQESTRVNGHSPEEKDIKNQEPQLESKKNGFPDVKRKNMTAEERTRDIEIGLTWIRRELNEMRAQDRSLTKELIGLRSKVQEIGDLVEPQGLEENSKTDNEQ